MNTFNKKSLYVALASLGALGVTDAAQAVNINPDGLGQVLIYPYFTTRADAAGNVYNSLLSVVNSGNTAKAVKVRFLEGKNSREVLDFNLFLSGFDMWTAAIVASPSGGAKVMTTDKSCTLPAIPAGGQDFVNFAYTGSADDKGGTSLDRTKEGYVEIIEMAQYSDNSTTSINVTHVGGVPPGCAKVTDKQAANDANTPTGGLFGGITLINVNAGLDVTADAVALDNFYTVGSNYFSAGDVRPDLSGAQPPISRVAGVNNAVYTSVWNPGADPVSAVLMHDAIMNEFVLDNATKSGTDWVVTFPTKRFYVNTGTGLAPGTLFQRNFNTTAGSCDDVTLSIYDREERTTSSPLQFSPPPPTQTNSLCWEANVVTFNNSNVLGSVNLANIPTTFENGWLRIGFDVVSGRHMLENSGNTDITFIQGGTSAGQSVTYFGLPVVGFAVQTFKNGTVLVNAANVLSNYGGNFVQKATTLIVED